MTKADLTQRTTYIGTKIVEAMPMTRGEYNALRGWTVPADENPQDTGYLVEYRDGGKANHPEFAGYISWSPASVFERAYSPVNDAGLYLTFGQALICLKAGAKVARIGWNGKGMWLSLSGPLQGREVQAHAFWSDNNRTYAEGLENKTATVLPSITMKTATGEILMGWLASQSDMLAEDWVLVP